jgi:hypothetical protein
MARLEDMQFVQMDEERRVATYGSKHIADPAFHRLWVHINS